MTPWPSLVHCYYFVLLLQTNLRLGFFPGHSNADTNRKENERVFQSKHAAEVLYRRRNTEQHPRNKKTTIHDPGIAR